MKKYLSDQVNLKGLNETIDRGNRILKVIYLFLIIIAVYVLTKIAQEWRVFIILGGILKALIPVFIGFFLAWALTPLVKYLETKKIRKVFSISAIYLILIIILYIFLVAFVPIMVDQVKILIDALPEIGNSVNLWLTNFLRGFDNIIDVSGVRTTIDQQLLNIATNLSKTAPDFVITSVSGIIYVLFTLLVGLMVGFYLLIDYQGISKYILRFIPTNYREDTRVLIGNINKELYTYVRGLGLVLITLFVICAIIFNIIGLKAALLIAFICMITDIIPYIGPFIGGAVAAIVGFSQSLTVGLITIIAILVIQQIEGNILQPVIMGKTMRLHPVSIIAGLLVFGQLFGIFGMIIATPLIAIIKVMWTFYQERVAKDN